jgi:4-hydroxymandelate oxidase
MSINRPTRRDLLAAGAAPLLQPRTASRGQPRLPPLAELVNPLEFEDAARTALDPAAFAMVAGGDRQSFDLMTFRPRMFVDSAPLDLTIELLGEELFAPVLVSPIAGQRQFHAEGELATVQGAAAAKTPVVISSRSSYTFGEIAARAQTPLWYQAYLERDTGWVRSGIQQAVAAGCRAVCLTAGDQPPDRPPRAAAAPRPNWKSLERLRPGVSVPVLLKGVLSGADARTAVDSGVAGIIVSNGGLAGARPAPMEVLAAVVDAVGGRVPVLIDGSFRRGTDAIKALALGARAILVGRPVMWGLAAYGADGVHAVLTMLQTEIARNLINIGKPTIPMLDRTVVALHSRATS